MHRAGRSVQPRQGYAAKPVVLSVQRNSVNPLDRLKELRETLKNNLADFETHSKQVLTTIPFSAGEVAAFVNKTGVNSLIDSLVDFIKHYSSEARRSTQANRLILNDMKVQISKLAHPAEMTHSQETMNLMRAEIDHLQDRLVAQWSTKVHALEQKTAKLEHNLENVRPKQCQTCPNLKLEVTSLQALLECQAKELVQLKSQLEQEVSSHIQVRRLLSDTDSKYSFEKTELELKLNNSRSDTKLLESQLADLKKAKSQCEVELVSIQAQFEVFKQQLSGVLEVKLVETSPQQIGNKFHGLKRQLHESQETNAILQHRVKELEAVRSDTNLTLKNWLSKSPIYFQRIWQIQEEASVSNLRIQDLELQVQRLATMAQKAVSLLHVRRAKPVRIQVVPLEPLVLPGRACDKDDMEVVLSQLSVSALQKSTPSPAKNDRFHFNLDDSNTFGSMLQKDNLHQALLPAIHEVEDSGLESPATKLPLSTELQRLAALLCLTPNNLTLMKVKDLVALIEARLLPLAKLQELQDTCVSLQDEVTKLQQDLKAKSAEVDRLRVKSNTRESKPMSPGRRPITNTPVSLAELRKSTSAGQLGVMPAETGTSPQLRRLYVQQSVAAKQLQLLLFVAHKDALMEKSRAERFFREANRMRNELEAMTIAQEQVIEEKNALLAENTQLKISFENIGKGKPAAKLTQEFNSLLLDKGNWRG